MRLKVRTLTAFVLGDCPMPMQGPQAHSSTRAPAAIISASAPHLQSIASTCREPGLTVKLTLGATVLPFSIAATLSISARLEFVQLPMQTWSTAILVSSETAFMLSGLCGHAASGRRAERSITTLSSYSAFSSATSGEKSCSLPCAFKNARVVSSAGNTEAVAPSSAPMLAIVALSGTERAFTPSPQYSITLPTPPLTVSKRSTSSMISLAAALCPSLPLSSTLTTLGMVRYSGAPPMASATSSPPAPMASIPMPPHVGV